MFLKQLIGLLKISNWYKTLALSMLRIDIKGILALNIRKSEVLNSALFAILEYYFSTRWWDYFVCILFVVFLIRFNFFGNFVKTKSV